MRRRPAPAAAAARLTRCAVVVAFLASWGQLSPALAATIRLDATAQVSHSTGSRLTLSTLTVGNGPERLLVVGVVTPGQNNRVVSVTWGGVPLVRVGGAFVTQADGSGGCTAELWRLIAPASGNHPVEVTLPSSVPCIVGAASFTGVDQASPNGSPPPAQFGAGSPIDLNVGGNGAPIVGSMCLQGSWSSGSNAPNATTAQGTAPVWDLADQTVMALGGFQTNMAPNVHWTATPNTFIWTGTGVGLNASATADPPDASAPDTAPPVPPDAAVSPADARAAADAAQPPDAAPAPTDGPMVARDAFAAGDLGVGNTSDTRPPPEAAADSGVSRPDPEAGVVVRDLRLQVGCACSAGDRAASFPAGTALLLGLGTLSLRLMRRRTATEPSGPRRSP